MDLLLPRVCLSCENEFAGARGDVICPTCWSRLSLLPHPQCERCGHPTEGRACRFCELLLPFVRSARSACWVPHETGSAVVRALKYHGWVTAARGIADRLSRLAWPEDVVRERAALVPVPLSSARERERGFNQAALIADALAVHWNVPVWRDAIARTRFAQTQTRLTPAERSANVLGAFSVPGAAQARLRGRHLVLVDDVLTTGATLNACASALFDAGARILSYVTFGRARASGDR
jgi:ComF family protein